MIKPQRRRLLLPILLLVLLLCWLLLPGWGAISLNPRTLLHKSAAQTSSLPWRQLELIDSLPLYEQQPDARLPWLSWQHWLLVGEGAGRVVCLDAVQYAAGFWSGGSYAHNGLRRYQPGQLRQYAATYPLLCAQSAREQEDGAYLLPLLLLLEQPVEAARAELRLWGANGQLFSATLAPAAGRALLFTLPLDHAALYGEGGAQLALAVYYSNEPPAPGDAQLAEFPFQLCLYDAAGQLLATSTGQLSPCLPDAAVP